MGFAQEFLTETHAEDNRGGVHMVTAQQPTHQTQHINMKQFVVLQWCEEVLQFLLPTAHPLSLWQIL
jgi:hypothetical protein